MVRPKRRYAENIYYSEKAGLRTILFFLIIILIIVAGLYFLYNFYENIPEDPYSLNASITSIPEPESSNFGDVGQFYPNMKFNHNKLTYNIDLSCSSEKQKNVLEAFNLISDKVNISFYPSFENADIEVDCSKSEKYKEDSKFIVAGEGGAREIVETGRYSIINSGVIYLYPNMENSIQCDWPATELHELMHVFGFNHSLDKKSLMYPYLESCDQKLDNSIFYEMNRLYNQPHLPDLYFQNISAVKKGRYLDFNFTIKNSGDMDANNLSFSIVEDGKLVETKPLNELFFGAGIVMEVNNLKLLKTNSKEIKIILDYYNNIPEIEEKNNIAILKFN